VEKMKNEYDRVVAPVSAHDVVRELRRQLPDIGTVKAHKLLYFAQGLHLGLTGEPIFRERVEAWAMGPVVADLWHDEHKSRPVPPAMSLSDTAISIVDEVVRRFEKVDAEYLIRLTHTDGGPWCQVTETGDEFVAAQSQAIETDRMAAWFEQDESIVAHREAAERIRRRRIELESAGADETGLLGALERMAKGDVLCESRPV
jgi:uncharacterized phage-associated protein